MLNSNPKNVVSFNNKMSLPFVKLKNDAIYSVNNSNTSNDPMKNFLQSQKPFIIKKNQIQENFNGEYGVIPNDIIIPPLNTDLRFQNYLTVYKGSDRSSSHPHAVCEDLNCKTNTHDKIQYSQLPVLPEQIHENFSWAITTEEDNSVDIAKKSIINRVPTQYACGSCWAVCIAGTISDCLVVSGLVNWAPNISSTYIMGVLPTSIHNKCAGGNPASALQELQNYNLVDNSCIDYSWCSGDDRLCKSVDSSSHFDAKYLSDTLNSQIPSNPAGCYFPYIQKWVYNIDSSNIFHIDSNVKIDKFRNITRAHILDNGPVIGGFVVLSNFFKGLHASPTLNGGVYFDRADYNNYSGGQLSFYDSLTDQASGLHAISIVGYGVAKNIQYDNNKFGDVPYWHCRNSWGPNWGNCGFFKMAMYPFNMVSQFDHLVYTSLGGPVGGVVMIKTRTKPKKASIEQISQGYLNAIKRVRRDEYYQANADEIATINGSSLSTDIVPNVPNSMINSSLRSTENNIPILILLIILVVILGLKLI